MPEPRKKDTIQMARTVEDREKAALAHLKRINHVLYTAALPHRGQILSRIAPKRTRNALFVALASSIVSQQLSTKAAASIYARLSALLGGTITPKGIVQMPGSKLRTAGLSEAKVLSLKDLAGRIERNELSLLALKKLPPEDAVQELVAVRGIGPWTAEMFMIFGLGASDVFSPGDLILARMTKKFYDLPPGTKAKELHHIAEAWSPYRSYVSLLLWKLNDQK